MTENAYPDFEFDDTQDDESLEDENDIDPAYDGYCVFCGEELETNSNGYIICRYCWYDEEYEKGKLG